MTSQTKTVTEFWVSSGHHMTRRTDGGGLAVTDEIILAYLARPELVPPEDACDAERALHSGLIEQPRRPVTKATIEALADPDARENWHFMIGFRDRLLGCPSVEAAYLSIVRTGVQLPPLFLNQLVHLILRNALDGCEDPFTLRAAELFFRPQKASLKDGTLLLADLELVEELETERQSLMHPAPLSAMLGQDGVSQLDIMTEETAPTYWSRSDAFSMVMNFGGDGRSRAAFCRVIEAWVAHMLAIETRVTTIERIDDSDWRWFVGLDAEATAIGNRLWKGAQVDPTDHGRIIGLFRLDFADGRVVDPKMAGKPVYLLMAVGDDMVLRVKPQNLIAGLPLTGALAA